MDLLKLGTALSQAGAPMLGSALQTATTALAGPVAGKIVGAIVGAAADALGTEATPEAVAEKLATDPTAPAAVQKLDATEGPRIQEEVQARLRDVQDARATTLKLVEQGSTIAWGAPIVSVIVMLGFGLFSYLAIYAPSNQREVLLFLLGNWSIMAGAVVTYWLGSSAGSASKEAALTSLVKDGRR
jgi:hypothetical protein